MALRIGTCSFSAEPDGSVRIDEITVTVQILEEEKTLTFRLGDEVVPSDLWVWSDIALGTKGRISKLRVPQDSDDRFIQVKFEGQMFPRNFFYWELSSQSSTEKVEALVQDTTHDDDGSALDLENPIFNPFR